MRLEAAHKLDAVSPLFHFEWNFLRASNITSLTLHDSHCPYIILTKSDTSCPLLVFIFPIYMSPFRGRRIFYALTSGLFRGLSLVNEDTGNKLGFLGIFPGPL